MAAQQTAEQTARTGEKVLYDLGEAGVATITLNDPDTRHAPSPQLPGGLIEAFPLMIMALIYRNVPRKKANELRLLGERWSAQEALAAGLVNRVVPASEFDAAVADWAGKLAAKSPVIMRLGKDAMRRQLDMP